MSLTIFFAGGLTNEPDAYMKDIGASRLFSQLNDKKGISTWSQFISEKPLLKLFIDSGAFSAKTQGVEIRVEDYVDKINNIGEPVNRFANLDVIPNSQNHNDIAVGARKGFENFMYIMENCKYKDKCIAVFHKNDPVDVLWDYINYYKKHPEMKYMALGGIVGGDPSSATYFATTYCDIIKKELPYVQIHLFGYTQLRNLPYINCDSVDSTTWIMVAANGSIVTDYGVLCVSEIMKKDKISIHNQPEAVVRAVCNYVEQCGYSMEELSQDYKKRMMFNIAYMKNWSDKYEYVGKRKVKKSLI